LPLPEFRRIELHTGKKRLRFAPATRPRKTCCGRLRSLRASRRCSRQRCFFSSDFRLFHPNIVSIPRHDRPAKRANAGPGCP
jgi:hypothetical protein